MDKVTIHYLIKIGKKEHIENLRNRGFLYLNTLDFFKEMEKDEQRKDIHEGIQRIEQITTLEISWEDKKFEFRKDSKEGTLSSGQFRITNPNVKGNIYSMIGVKPELFELHDSLDKMNAEFGDAYLLITNTKEFIRRIESEIKKRKLNFKFGVVKYYDEQKFNGDLDAFCKPKKFEHQSEVRIFIESNKNEPLILEIGSVADISKIYEISQFEKMKFVLE
jgi:hypothetical protein